MWFTRTKNQPKAHVGKSAPSAPISSSNCFGELLNLYFGGYQSDQWWLRLKLRLTRTKEFIARRERLKVARAKRKSKELITAEFRKKDYLMRKIPKDDLWTGKLLVMPFPSRFDDCKILEDNKLLISKRLCEKIQSGKF